MTQDDIDLVLLVIDQINKAKPYSSSATGPSKPDCKRVRRIKDKFTTLSQDDIDNCFCSTEDRERFWNAFLIEWNKKDLTF